MNATSTTTVDGNARGVPWARRNRQTRRRGLAGAILGALADWGQQLGAHTAYLQVEEDNPNAQRLYARTGFETVYGYHYRSLHHG